MSFSIFPVGVNEYISLYNIATPPYN